MFRRRLLQLVLAIALPAAVLMVAAPGVAAVDSYEAVRTKCSSTPGTTAAVVCRTTGSEDPLTGPNGVIPKVTRIIAYVAGVAALVVMIAGGIRYISSGGDPEQVARAKKTIIFAAVGMIVIVGGQWIINFVLSRV